MWYHRAKLMFTTAVQVRVGDNLLMFYGSHFFGTYTTDYTFTTVDNQRYHNGSDECSYMFFIRNMLCILTV